MRTSSWQAAQERSHRADSVNATGGESPWLAISGGEWTLNTQGDGLDSNGSAHLSGGMVTIWGPLNGGNGSLDAQNGMTVSGGTLFTAGAAGMAEGPETNSEQASIMVSGSASSGSVMEIVDSSGKTIASYTLQVDAQSFIFSSSAITAGQEYTVKVDGSEVVTATAGEYTSNSMGGGVGGGMGGGQRP